MSAMVQALEVMEFSWRSFLLQVSWRRLLVQVCKPKKDSGKALFTWIETLGKDQERIQKQTAFEFI